MAEPLCPIPLETTIALIARPFPAAVAVAVGVAVGVAVETGGSAAAGGSIVSVRSVGAPPS